MSLTDNPASSPLAASTLALSPLDGRYAAKVEELRPLLSEYGLIKHRLEVEAAWLIALANESAIAEVPALNSEDQKYLTDIVTSFSSADAQQVKYIESTTNHDVKAVEYFLKEKLQARESLRSIIEFVHFSCTSEDINNLSYALMVKNARDQVILPLMDKIIIKLSEMARSYATQPMLAHTHGQSATPTTVGKEIANVIMRLKRQREQLAQQKILGKINGAVGNYNAHLITYPEVDWQALSRSVVEGLGLAWNTHTTQIEPHDYLAELFHQMARFNSIIIDLNRDCWGYISLGYFKQQMVEGEVGSSTMPHKVNPIDFENSEGNLGLANGIFQFLAGQLPTSRWQRDLVDSTLLRNVGVAMGHSVVGYQSTLKGLGKLAINQDRLEQDLADNLEVLAEAVQTVMRRHGVDQPYEHLKALTRGKRITKASLDSFINDLPIPDDAKDRLLALTPRDYIGLAVELANQV